MNKIKCALLKNKSEAKQLIQLYKEVGWTDGEEDCSLDDILDWTFPQAVSFSREWGSWCWTASIKHRDFLDIIPFTVLRDALLSKGLFNPES